MELPEGATIKAASGGPGADDEVYEWTADPNRTFEELPAEEIYRRSEHVSRVYRKWSDKFTTDDTPEAKAKRDDQVRQIVLSVDQECIDFSRRFPHRFRQLTDNTLVDCPLMARHQGAMLEIWRRKQAGEISDNRAKQLVAQLAQRTILDKTNALPADELARLRSERSAEKAKGDR